MVNDQLSPGRLGCEATSFRSWSYADMTARNRTSAEPRRVHQYAGPRCPHQPTFGCVPTSPQPKPFLKSTFRAKYRSTAQDAHGHGRSSRQAADIALRDSAAAIGFSK